MSELLDLYQELILDHNKSPRNRRKLDGPHTRAEGFNPLCGDHGTVFVQVEDGMVKDVSFEGAGCAISTASASLMTQSLKGKTVKEAKALFEKFHKLIVEDSEDTGEGPELGKLKVFSGVCNYPARVKCATLAWHTVNAALNGGDQLVSTE